MASTVLPAVPQVLKIRLQHQVGEDAAAGSAFHWQYSGTAPTGPQLATLASGIAAAWNTNLAQLMTVNWSLNQVLVSDLTQQGAIFGVWNGSHAGTIGGATGQGMTAETAVVVNFHILRKYRGGHPRCYFPWGTQNYLADPQTWNGTFIGMVTSGWTAFAAAVGALAGPPVLGNQVNVGYFEGGSWIQHQPSGAWKFHPALASPTNVDQVIGFGVRAKPGSQRRRMLL